MKEKVVEILIYIMSAIQDDKRLSEIDVTDLRSRGYTQSEISAAFSWLYDNMRFTQANATPPGPALLGSRRFLHDVEKLVLSVEGQGYIIQLYELGVLNDRDLESVIERAVMTGAEKLTVDEIHQIVAAVLFTKEAGEDGANRSMLNSGETIH
jgi:uncharacterized protein Smg (DUF494 family)